MSNEEENQDGKRKLRIEVDRSPELEKLRNEKNALESELQEKKAILEAQAMTQLEKDRTEIMDMAKIGKLTDEQIAEIQEKLEDPKQLESIKMMVKIISDSVEKVKTDLTKKKDAPSGKASLTASKGNGTNYETKAELINDLYFRAYDTKAHVSAEEKEDAKQKIDQLWKSFMGNKTKTSMPTEELAKVLDITMCPSCGWANESRKNAVKVKCTKCGLEYK